MAFTIQHKRKEGALEGGDLTSPGEIAIDTDNKDIYFTTDGLDINLVGTVIDEDDMASNDATKVPSQQSVKAYVDSAVVGLLDYKGAYDANTNTPDLDESPSGIKKGDTYTVTIAGTFYTTAVEVGDVLIAEVDDAGTSSPPESDWTIVQRNENSVATTGGSLAQFAATTSAELADVIDDETGTTGVNPRLVFSNSPQLTTPEINDTTGDHQYIFDVAELDANRTVTLPRLLTSDTFVFEAHAQTLTNKTLTVPTLNGVVSGNIDCGEITTQ